MRARSSHTKRERSQDAEMPSGPQKAQKKGKTGVPDLLQTGKAEEAQKRKTGIRDLDPIKLEKVEKMEDRTIQILNTTQEMNSGMRYGIHQQKNFRLQKRSVNFSAQSLGWTTQGFRKKYFGGWILEIALGF